MPSINSVTWSSERLVVRAISTNDLNISDSSSLSITPLLSLSHMSKMIRNLSSVLPRENSKTVSKNSWNLNRSSLMIVRQDKKVIFRQNGKSAASMKRATIIPGKKSGRHHLCQRCWTFSSRRLRRAAYREHLQTRSWKAMCALPWRPLRYHCLQTAAFARRAVNRKSTRMLLWRTNNISQCYRECHNPSMYIINIINLYVV